MEREDSRTNPPPTDTSAGMLLDFSLFPGTAVGVRKYRLPQGDSKGTHSYHPSPHFLFEYLLGVFLHF